MIKGVIFDMDGVIIDSEPIHFKVEKAILSNFNEPFTMQDHARFVGGTPRNLYKTICEERGINQSFEVLALLDAADYMEELKRGHLEAIEGIPELIKGLKKSNVPMVLASSANHNNIEIVLDRLELKEYFEGRVSGQDVERTKPDPEIFIKAADILGLKPENCLVIEDANHGVEAAKAAGMYCVAYRNLNSGNQNLSMADLIIDNIADLDIKSINQSISQTNNNYVT